MISVISIICCNKAIIITEKNSKTKRQKRANLTKIDGIGANRFPDWVPRSSRTINLSVPVNLLTIIAWDPITSFDFFFSVCIELFPFQVFDFGFLLKNK